MTVVAILQARMSSRRLPGKVMERILGEPMLARQIERIRKSRELHDLIIATSAEASDDPISALATSLAVKCHRGPLDDVLARFVGALDLAATVEHVVRLTGDCPLTDWSIIDQCVIHHLKSKSDYTSNAIVRTYPDGLDVEVMTASALRSAARLARSASEREHVTPFIYQNRDSFTVTDVTQTPNLSALRWTVDTPEDLDFVRDVYARLYPSNPSFGSSDILALPFGQRLA